jgi:hypothetical protein
MLPPIGSPERDALQQDAASVAIEELRRERGDIANALYKTYLTFRHRFLEERGLMDVVPGREASSIEALEDARLLELYVCQRWASIILALEGTA